MKTKKLHQILKISIEMMTDIVAEILCSHAELLEEISLHDQKHKVSLMKKIVFSFLFIKGRHLCKSTNIEENSLTRHQKTKEVLFKHE